MIRVQAGLCRVLAVALLALPRCAAAQESNRVAAFQPRTTVRKTNDAWSGACTYSLVSGQFFDWNTDPTAVPGLFREVEKRAGIQCRIDVGAVSLDSPRIGLNPVIIMTGNRVFRLSDAEVQNLGDYLRGGGFIYADDCGGSDFSFRRMLKQIVPEGALVELPPSHPIFSSFYKLDHVPKIVDLYHGPAKLLGLTLHGRLAAVYTYDTDVPCAWEIYPDGSYVHVVPEDKREGAFELGVNVLLYALSEHASVEPALSRAATPGTPPPVPPAQVLPPTAVRVYRMQRQLPCDYIIAMAGDEQSVWFGGWSYLPGEDEGLARYDRATGGFRLYMDAEGVLAEEINSLTLRGGKVYIGADTWKFSRGLSVLDPANRSWKSYTAADGLPHDRVIDVRFCGHEAWIACRSGLALWDMDQNAFRSVEVPGGEQRDFMICLAATEKTIWISNFEHVWRHVLRAAAPVAADTTAAPPEEEGPGPAADGDVYAHINPGPPVRERMTFTPRKPTGGAGAPPPSVPWEQGETLTPLLQGSATAMAGGTDRVYIAPLTPSPAPVVVCDERSGRCSALAAANDPSLGAITALAVWQPLPEDPAAASGLLPELWAGTADGDVACFVEDADGHSRMTVRQHIGTRKVLRIYASGPDVFASDADFGGVWHYNRPQQTWRQYKTRVNVPSDHLFALASSGGTLFVGTLSDGPWSFAPAEEARVRDTFRGGWRSLNYDLLQGGEHTVYLGDRDAIRYSSIYDLLPDASRVWMASNHGLLLHDPAQTPRGFEIIAGFKDPLARLALSKGTLYCGRREGGLAAFDVAQHAWRASRWHNDERITALAARGATVWVGTDHHLFGIADDATALQAFSNAATTVSALLADESGVWIATPEGIYRQAGAGFPSLTHPAAPVRNAVALLSTGRNLLFAANAEGLWRIRLSAAGAAGEVARYDLTPYGGNYPVTALALVGDRLYASLAGGGLLSIALHDLSDL